MTTWPQNRHCIFGKGSFSLVDFSIARQCHSWPRMTKETFVPQDPNAIIFSVGSDRGEDINQAHCGGSESCTIVLSKRDVSDALRNICSKRSFLCYQTCMYIFICIRTSKCLSKCMMSFYQFNTANNLCIIKIDYTLAEVLVVNNVVLKMTDFLKLWCTYIRSVKKFDLLHRASDLCQSMHACSSAAILSSIDFRRGKICSTPKSIQQVTFGPPSLPPLCCPHYY